MFAVTTTQHYSSQLPRSLIFSEEIPYIPRRQKHLWPKMEEIIFVDICASHTDILAPSFVLPKHYLQD